MSTLKVDTIQGKTTSGTIAMPAGHVIQIVKSTVGTSGSTTSTSFVATDIAVNITPKFNNSLIRIDVQGVWWLHLSPSSEEYFKTTVYRDSTNIGNGTAGMNTVYATGTRMQGNPTVGVVDSPSSTSQITYTLKIKGAGGSTTFNANTCQATIILMEITP